MLYVKADDETIAMTDKREIIGIAYHTSAGAQTAITYDRAQTNDKGYIEGTFRPIDTSSLEVKLVQHLQTQLT